MVADESHDDKTQSFVAPTKGTRVSHYEIIEKIGAGGMGEVYLAEDTQLDRKVALKFLPPHLCRDEAARARFTREAKAAAKLDHPNIVPVYEVGELQGRPFFAMAHIEGKSFKEVIKEGKLSIDEAIGFTKQICEGLHKAHESGVVHRDIKPSNIIIDGDDKVRILDFGLATVAGEDKLTKTGSTLGTVGYMSPEQIEGKPVDHRSDLFSVGVILYEMLTGRRPFDGDTDAAIARSITDKIPEPIARYKSEPTGELQQIVNKALEKDPSLRYQHADEMVADLRSRTMERSHSGRESVQAPARTKSRKWIWGLVLICVAVAAVAITVQIISREPLPRVIPNNRQVTYVGDVIACTISPDGTYLAYASGTQMANVQVMVQDISSDHSIQVFECKMVTDMCWSPDGTSLLVQSFRDSRYEVSLIPRFGGDPRYYPIAGGRDLCWSPSGAQFAVLYSKTVVFVDRESGQTSTLSLESMQGEAQDIDWSPVGNLILVSTSSPTGSSLWTMRVDGSTLTKVIDASSIQSPWWSSHGNAVYFLQEYEGAKALMKLPIMVNSGVKDTAPTILVTGLNVREADQISLSTDANRLLYVKRLSWSNLSLFQPAQGKGTKDGSVRQLTKGTSFVSGPSISPDGSTVAFNMTIGDETHIYTMPIDGGDMKRLTHTGRRNLSPAWSPDGDEIIYKSWSDGTYYLSLIDAGGGTPSSFAACDVSKEQLFGIVWSPGEYVLYHASTTREIFVLDPHTGKTRPLVDDGSSGGLINPRYSPDGRSLAVYWRGDGAAVLENRADSGKAGIWTISLQESTRAFVTPGFSISPIGWTSDGRYIYFLVWGHNVICRVPETGGVVDTIATLPFKNVDWVEMSPDGSQFICQLLESKSDVWVVENFDPDLR
jgi:Tol biopolymer transport system component/predicted Ser/Thr protein kinase